MSAPPLHLSTHFIFVGNEYQEQSSRCRERLWTVNPANFLLRKNKTAPDYRTIRLKPAQASSFEEAMTMDDAFSRDSTQLLLIESRLTKNSPAVTIAFISPYANTRSPT